MAAVLDLDLVAVVKRRANIIAPGGGLGQRTRERRALRGRSRWIAVSVFPRELASGLLEKLGLELNYLILGAEYFCFPFL